MKAEDMIRSNWYKLVTRNSSNTWLIKFAGIKNDKKIMTKKSLSLKNMSRYDNPLDDYLTDTDNVQSIELAPESLIQEHYPGECDLTNTYQIY